MRMAIGFLLCVLVFISQTLLVPGTGMTWDEPASWFIGRANIKFWATGNRRYIEDVQNKALFAKDPIKYIFGEEYYPPFSFVIQSAFSYVLSERLQLVSSIEAHHIGEVAIGAIGVWAFFLLAAEIGISVPVAIVTTLIYATYPTIFGQMRSDAKDIPLMSLLVVTMYFFVLFMKSWSGRKHLNHIVLGILASVALGASLASKPTAVVVLPIVGIWFVVAFVTSKNFRQKIHPVGRLLTLVPFLLLVAGATAIVLWPWLWGDMYWRIIGITNYFKVVGYLLPVQYFGIEYRAGINVPWHYAFAMLGIQTPLEVLVLAVVGVGVGLWQHIRHKNVYATLAFFWFFLAIGRFLLPSMIIYAKVRHFIDAMPAFFLLVGWGIEGFIKLSAVSWQLTARTQMQKIVLILIAVFVIGHQVWINVRLYPYEPSYFNILVGGVKNVADKQLFDAEYWASGIKESMDFVKSTPATIQRTKRGEHTVINACFLRHLAYYYKTPLMDITLYGGATNYTLIPNSPSLYRIPISFYKANHHLVYTVKRDGADLYYVFEQQTPWGWYCGQETAMTYE